MSPHATVELRVLGYRTNDSGEPEDIDADGSISLDDWHELVLRQWVDAPTPEAVRTLQHFHRVALGIDARQTPIKLARFDANGYPTMTQTGVFSGYVASDNRYRSAEDQNYRSVHYDAMAGEYYLSYPMPVGRIAHVLYNHDGNFWLRYDDATDAYTIDDPRLSALLARLRFEPTFWMMAKLSHVDAPALSVDSARGRRTMVGL
jgi:hypothetical protein